MSKSVTVSFRLRAENIGSSCPVLIGNHKQLQGPVAMFQENGFYNWIVKVTFTEPPTGDFTYNYALKTQFGALVQESIPPRTLPKFVADAQVYDTFNQPNPVSAVTIRFRVRVYTPYGQEVMITGDVPELGNWDPTKAVPLFYENNMDYWSSEISIPLSTEKRTLNYKYLVSRPGAVDHWEPEDNHALVIDETPSPCVIEVSDQYRWTDPVLEAFTRAAFTQVVNRREHPQQCEIISPEKAEPALVRTYIQVYCPFVRSNQHVVVVGSIPELGQWKPSRGLVLKDGNFPFWNGVIELPLSAFPFEYKFVIANKDETYIWEQEPNRICDKPTASYILTKPLSYFVNSWFICPNKDLFKGLGVYVPIFSLRTENSQGIGSYTDIIKLVDVCNKMGASLIQLLPINDTTDKGEWCDSYPYKQVSCFALNPVYIDLLDVYDKMPSEMRNEIYQKKRLLEQSPTVDFPAVFKFKMDILKRIFAIIEKDFAKSKELDAFLKKNGHWLKPYALYVTFRAVFGTNEFRKWPKYSKVTPEEIEKLSEQMKDKLLFTYWIQYIADVQYKKSYDYASEHKVALKGDLPIGVNINSVECWAFPNLFRLHMCAGAPPDDFSADGQNWGFPTYNWDVMEKDGFAWWKARLQRMSELYHALRVDHVLGFFRIWEIPRDSCVRGLLGHFFPSNPLTRKELENMGLWDIDRYVKPYVRWHLIRNKFGAKAEEIAKKYFVARNQDANDDYYDFKKEYDNEAKIYDALQKDSTLSEAQKSQYQQSLFELISSVLLVPDGERDECYHVRTEITKEKVEMTKDGPIILPNPSLVELDDGTRKKFEDLYVDFTYRRQTDLWVQKAQPKLAILKKSTKMLICAEDLGQITPGIIKCLDQSGLLSLRVQRMSKDPNYDFDDFHQFKYLSVACPSTHDTSSLRGWWEENRSVTSKFWYEVLSRHEDCPRELSTYFQEMIIKQNIYSNSMWSIFLLQDLTGIREDLRRQSPEEERINYPVDPNYKWRYRYPYTLEELAQNQGFIKQMRGLVEASHRI